MYLDEDYASLKSEPNEQLEFEARSSKQASLLQDVHGANFENEIRGIDPKFQRVSEVQRSKRLNQSAIHSTQRSQHSSARLADQVRGLASDYQSSLSQGRVVPFIDLDVSSGQFVLSNKLRTLCKTQLNPMATISIIGAKNSGKSFLLNHLIGIEKAFAVNKQASANAPTKNLMNVVQVFSEPIQIDREGFVYDIYIVDCEGFDEGK